MLNKYKYSAMHHLFQGHSSSPYFLKHPDEPYLSPTGLASWRQQLGFFTSSNNDETLRQENP